MYALCASGAANPQDFVWKFICDIYTFSLIHNIEKHQPRCAVNEVPITAGSCKDNRRLVLTYPSNIYHLQTSLTFSVSLSSSAVFSLCTPQGRGGDTPLSSQHQHVAILPLAQPLSHEFSIHSSSVDREFNGARIGPAVHSSVAMSTRACCTAI